MIAQSVRQRWGSFVIPTAMVLLLSACAPADPRLLTWSPGQFCSLAELLPSTLVVDLDQQPAVWVDREGTRIDVAWPEGFRLVEAADGHRVEDDEGHIVVQEGQLVTGGGEMVDGVFRLCIVGDRFYNR